ncbi:MAG: hypothetical protein HYS22_04760 [Deltaproteobacteria bacterium]|nr:hypothetical protein [Deltaproteobacteria bacterium]
MRSSIFSILSLFFPALALACPSCYWADARNLWAYYGSTILMSLLPLLLLGVLGWWVYRLMK